MKELRFALLALLLLAILAIPALADDGPPTFDPGKITVTADEDSITVEIAPDNEAVLQLLKPSVAIPCDFARASVAGPGVDLKDLTPVTVEGVKVIVFQVARPGTYIITDTTPAQRNDGSADVGAPAAGGAEKDPVEVRENEDGTVSVIFNDVDAGPLTVEIPAADAGPGTVLVLVHEDGTEEIVKDTKLTGGGLALTLEGDCTLRIVDNSQSFSDVPADHWAADAVTCVAARELFIGTGDDEFSPDLHMTRGMLMTVLARLDGADAYGDDWLDKGLAWAVENGVSDGTDPEADVTREQIVTMLWRMAGCPAPAGDLSDWPDGADASGWAAEALAWAVETGIMQGDDTGALDPRSPALRSHVAQLLMNFINLA